MLLALDRLAAIGYEANAHGCREFPEALALLRARRAAGTLPHVVVIALGADGQISHGDVGRALGLLCCTHLLVLVTPRELGGGSGSDAAVVRDEVARHRNRAVLLDWVRYSAGHGDWFQPDGIHLTTGGAIAFTRFLAGALRYAYPVVWKHASSGDGALPSAWRRSRPGDRSALIATPAVVPSVLRLRASLAHVGYVGVTLAAPPGTRVRLAERHAGTDRTIATMTIAKGTAQLPHALTWRCDRRDRTLIAKTLSPAPSLGATVTASVRTRSCARRFAIRIDPHARVAHHLTVHVRDWWGLGDVPARICVTPPGGRRACNRWWLHHLARRTITIATPRPGGWIVAVRGFGDVAHDRVVWAEHSNGRLRMYAAGDSEMQLLDDFLKSRLAPHGVGVREDARISTGLTKPFFFDWQAQARATAGGFQPDVSAVYMGANDGFSAPGKRGPIVCCAWPWGSGYAQLVAQMMRTLLRGAAGRVYWYTIPAPVPGQFSGLISAVNAGIRQAAREFRGRVALIDLNAIFTPGNRYRDFMTYHGHGFVIHESDGVHISVSADRVAAEILIDRMRADRVTR